MSKRKILNLFWFRRDLRLEDNRGLYECLSSNPNVQPIFIFDSNILEKLPRDDRRVSFIHSVLSDIKIELKKQGSDLWVFYGTPQRVVEQLLVDHEIESITCNVDYEPYATQRDQTIAETLKKMGKKFVTYKDIVIFEKSEILSDQQRPYLVYTPYKNKWLKEFSRGVVQKYSFDKVSKNLNKVSEAQIIPSLMSMGFEKKYPVEILGSEDQNRSATELDAKMLKNYERDRNYPSYANATSKLGMHLRFGTVSVRKLVTEAKKLNADVWLSELIWREFFMQILWHFPEVETRSFRPAYERVPWRKSESDFKLWSEGQTGYPIVDAGMRELVSTGYMHNRVRMITASFLTKHLLIHWRQGERFFAQHLLDFDLAANVGNWQWAAGTGCDAAPYFRIFNPAEQIKKFDARYEYIKKWVPEFQTSRYPAPMVDHKMARERALSAFKQALNTDN